MATTANPGDTVYQIFCLPPNASVMASPRVFCEGAVVGAISVDTPEETAGSTTTHSVWTVDYELPGDATAGQVFHLIVDWKDPSGDLQPPMIFDTQIALSGVNIEISY